MDFSETLLQIKQGKSAKRKGWKPNRYIFIAFNTPFTYSEIRLMMEDNRSVAWFPNRCDILMEDWEVF